MMLTQHDYDCYACGKVTIRQLCYSYKLADTTMRKHIRKFKGGRAPLTREDKEQIRAELLNAVPYDTHYSTQAILARWRIKSITQALQLLKVSSMAELRLGTNGAEIKALLKKYRLRLVKTTLYAPGNRGMYYVDRQLTIDLDALKENPKEWFKNNLELIHGVCYKTDAKEKPKTLSTQTLRRWRTAKKTEDLLRTKHTVREIKTLAGTDKYIKALRNGNLEDLFTDEELELLQKGGLI